MRQYLLSLVEIQKIDLEIREHEKLQESLPQALRLLEGDSATLKSQIETLKIQQSSVAEEAKTLWTGVEEESLKIRKWEARLQDIRNTREYQALLRETEGAKRAMLQSEDKIRELHKTESDLETQITGLQERYDAAQAGIADEKQKLQSALDEVNHKIAEHTKKRTDLTPGLPAPVYRKYEAIRQKRLGQGLSMVSQGCCTTCNMRLPPQLYNILQRGDSLEQCPSCFRLIFWENLITDPEPAGTGDAAPA